MDDRRTRASILGDASSRIGAFDRAGSAHARGITPGRPFASYREQACSGAMRAAAKELDDDKL
jgi:hypothetical protein